jgi:hypothetical protein
MLSVALATLALPASAAESDASLQRTINLKLTGFEEVPAIVTDATGSARLRIVGQTIHYRLSYAGTEGTVTQAHIHIGDDHTNGSIAAFFCSNLGNGPAGTQACPPSGQVSGTIGPADVVASAAAQGVAAGEFDDLLRAIRAGTAYVNVHSATFPSGEIRADLKP